MNLWRIENGLPSLADGLLVAGGLVGGIFLLTTVLDPVLNYFEPRGLLYLGYAFLFSVFSVLGGIGFLVFWQNQNKIREEIRVPRIVFAFATPPLILLFQSVVIAWLWPDIIHKKITFEDAARTAGALLIIIFAILYAGVVRAAIRWPARTTIIALWFNVGMGMLGAVAKFVKLFIHR